jgi:hypothetical protein
MPQPGNWHCGCIIVGQLKQLLSRSNSTAKQFYQVTFRDRRGAGWWFKPQPGFVTKGFV